MSIRTRITISIWILSAFVGALFVLMPVVAVNAEPDAATAQPFFKLLPTPTGTCPGELTCKAGTCQGKTEGGGTQLPGYGQECNYAMCDFLQLFVNAMNIIISIFGGVALVLLVWGSIGFMMSAGSEERVTKSKDLIKNTVLGTLVILLAWQFVAILIRFAVFNFDKPDDANPLGAAWNLSGDVHKICDKLDKK
ncbi:hypothetical protein HY629_02520 [Candidatus Uhrbacteria bacterium]|nr:hypothetical protein [Candidatus Uhrbacteria bacterium]